MSLELPDDFEGPLGVFEVFFVLDVGQSRLAVQLVEKQAGGDPIFARSEWSARNALLQATSPEELHRYNSSHLATLSFPIQAPPLVRIEITNAAPLVLEQGGCEHC